MHFKILLTIIFAVTCFRSSAQTETQEAELRILIESAAETLPEDYDFIELIEILNQFRLHPININKTTPDELKTLVFLSPQQIANLFRHIRENGDFIDVLEIQSIEGFNIKTIELLLPLITVGGTNNTSNKITLSGLLREGSQDLLMRYGRIMEKQRGFTDLPGSHYTGSPEKFQMRYHYQYRNSVYASITLEKDAGEKFVSNTMDFTSASFALIRNGFLKKLVIGDYSLQFGQGITLWSGFSFGKGPDVASITKRDLGLRPYTSTNEYSFFRGTAATFQLKKNLEFTPFVSFRKLDANQNYDPYGNLTQSTINQTGLHRTPTEISNKGTLNQFVYGLNLHYQKNDFTIGGIAYRSHFSSAFVTLAAPYDLFSFAGDALLNTGLYYNYGLKNFYVFGEIGKDLNGGFALLNGALISLSSTASIAFAHRNYAANYHSFFSQALGESSDSNNERGLYTGINVNPNKKWSFSAYADYFEFPWLKYRVDAPSSGYETQIQCVFSPSKLFKILGRLRSEHKQQNTDLPTTIKYLDNIKKDNYRLDISWILNSKLSLQNRLEICNYKKGFAANEYGYLVFQDLKYRPKFSKISGNLRLAYFKTAGYNSRIYAYEDDVLYSFIFGMYNGRGIRTYLNLKYSFSKKFNSWFRYAISYYPEQQTIGSYLDEIQGNKKSDIKIQLRYHF